jgi:uncharacterized protein YegL
MQSVKGTLLVSLLLITSGLLPLMGVLAAEGDQEDDLTEPIILYEGHDVQVLDAYAVTEVKRVLKNPSNGTLNHTFIFRIPRGALISNFSIEVDDETFYADVLKKDEAEEKYNEAVESGHTAGLIASRGDKTFDYSVAFQPNEVLTATIRYEQVLLKENGWHQYDLLLDVTDPSEVAAFEVSMDVEAPSTIEEVNSSGYDDLRSMETLTSSRFTLSVNGVNMTPDENLILRWRAGAGSPAGVMYVGEWDGEGYFLHVYDPDPRIVPGGRMPKDFVFVLDTSGSMKGTKFAQSLEAMDYIYSTLNEGDTFSFVEFDSSSRVYSQDLLPVTDAELTKVRQFIDDLSAGGSTDIHSGVCDALDIFENAEDAVPVMVLLTDGRANTGIYHSSEFRQDVLRRNTMAASIFGIALGWNADWDLVEALSLENHGRAIWVGEDEDVVSSITDFVRSFSAPLMSNLRWDYGDSVTDVHPSKLRAHYTGSEVLVAGRYPAGLEEIPMLLTARTADGENVTEAVFPVDVLPGHEFVPRFWAFSRIQDLEDRMKYNGTDNDTIAQIIELAIEFHFATDHTSLFVELPDDIKERFESVPTPEEATEVTEGGVYPSSFGSYGRPPSASHSGGSSTGSSPPPYSSPPPGSSSPPAKDSSPPIADPPSMADPPAADSDGSTGGSTDVSEDQTSEVLQPECPTGDTPPTTGDGTWTDVTDPILTEYPDESVIEGSTDAPQSEGPDVIPEARKATDDARERTSIPMVTALSIMLIPLVAILGVGLHWHFVGRNRSSGRNARKRPRSP